MVVHAKIYYTHNDVRVSWKEESKAARSKQGVDDRDPGDDGYSWVATEDDGPISGATTWVVKGGSGSDKGKIGRRKLDGTEHILGTCWALYLSAETTAEVPAVDDLSGTTGDTARGALRTGGSAFDVCCVVLRGSRSGRAGDERAPAP